MAMMKSSWRSSSFRESGRGRLGAGDTSPVSTNLVYILWAVPTPICSLEAISLNVNPIPERCHTILQPISAEYGCVLATSMEVIAVANSKLARVNGTYAHAHNLKI